MCHKQVFVLKMYCFIGILICVITFYPEYCSVYYALSSLLQCITVFCKCITFLLGPQGISYAMQCYRLGP